LKLLIDPAQLDVRLSVFCGQVFRWRELGDGRLVGVEGNHWWLVEQNDSTITAEGNGDLAKWNRYFRSDEDWLLYGNEVRRRAPELGPFMDALPGLRLLRPSDSVEEAFSFLCTSNNHLKRITTMVETLASYGPFMVEVQGQRLHRFPSVERIAEIPEAELRSKGFGYRGATIPVAARQIVERGGLAWLEGLKDVRYEEAHASLLELSGVGPKLADCLCLFALGHDEAVPVDTHVWQASTNLYFPDLAGTTLTESRYRQVGDHFRKRLGKLAGWAHQFLFYENLLNWRRR
jgi:N-glycosylase/DNA lyase